MGGKGSGRHRLPWERKRTVDECSTLHATGLFYCGLLPSQLGAQEVIDWAVGFPVRFAAADGEEPALMLSYEPPYGPAGRVRLHVPLSSSRPHFGGARWWFRCPTCLRRVGVLYLPRRERLFGCRGCHTLAYPSFRSDDF